MKTGHHNTAAEVRMRDCDAFIIFDLVPCDCCPPIPIAMLNRSVITDRNDPAIPMIEQFIWMMVGLIIANRTGSLEVEVVTEAEPPVSKH